MRQRKNKPKNSLGFKSLMMIPILILIVALSSFFAIVLEWNSNAAILISIPIVVIPFFLFYLKYMEEK